MSSKVDDAGLPVTEAAARCSSLRAGLRRGARYCVGFSWALNIALLVVAFGWVYLFGQSRGVVELMTHLVAPAASPGIVILDPWRVGSGVVIGLVAGGLATCAWGVMLGSLFAGSARFRTTRMWLVFMAVTCGWLGLIVGWQTIYWLGQQRRVKPALPAADSMVSALRGAWPKSDSALPDIGPFLAYPDGAPTTLMTLGRATFPETQLAFSAVEKTGENAMRFELAGAEAGAWLEWRGDGSEPRSFVGGLNTKYEVGRTARLRPEWFLVRYRAAGLAEGSGER